MNRHKRERHFSGDSLTVTGILVILVILVLIVTVLAGFLALATC